MSQKSLYNKIKRAVDKRKTEKAQIRAIAKHLAQEGWSGQPAVHQAFGPGGDAGRGKIRIYLFEGTPAGSFALLTGPSYKSELKTMAQLHAMPVADGFSIAAVPADSRAKKRTENIVKSAKKKASGSQKRKRKSSSRKKKSRSRARKKTTSRAKTSRGTTAKKGPSVGKVVSAIRAVETTGNEAAAIVLVDQALTTVLKGVHKEVLGSPPRSRAAVVKSLGRLIGELYNAFTDNQPAPRSDRSLVGRPSRLPSGRSTRGVRRSRRASSFGAVSPGMRVKPTVSSGSFDDKMARFQVLFQQALSAA